MTDGRWLALFFAVLLMIGALVFFAMSASMLPVEMPDPNDPNEDTGIPGAILLFYPMILAAVYFYASIGAGLYLVALLILILLARKTTCKWRKLMIALIAVGTAAAGLILHFV